MKRLVIIVLVLAAVLSLCGCGAKYNCYECGESCSKAYYDMSADAEWVMCEDCARVYWMPLPYENFRVK